MIEGLKHKKIELMKTKDNLIEKSIHNNVLLETENKLGKIENELEEEEDKVKKFEEQCL